jgi:hypothetical protein
MNKPTKIIAKPRIDKSAANGKPVIMLLTDQGWMTIKALSRLVGIPHSTLSHRITASSESWAEPDIFDKFRKRRQREQVCDKPQPACQLIPKDKPGKPFTAPKMGSWERRYYIAAKYQREQPIKALQALDAEYRDCLKHHRAVCG